MEFFRFRRDIPFMSWGKYTTTISLATFIIAVFFLVTKGLNLGVDFTGGTVMEVGYSQAADLNRVRNTLAGIGMSDASVQNFGSSSEVLIRLPAKPEISSAQLSEIVMKALRQDDSTVDMRRVEFVGPQVGEELVENGALALLVVSLGIIAYLAVRFEWKFGVAAIIANLHDVVIILGFFAFFQWEFSLTVLAAVLAILGYSVNESVVVFDRIRENSRKYHRQPYELIINRSINETLSRTLLTSLTTLMVVVALFVLGGGIIHDFAFALIIGVVVGTYSSVYVASPVLIVWQETVTKSKGKTRKTRRQK